MTERQSAGACLYYSEQGQVAFKKMFQQPKAKNRIPSSHPKAKWGRLSKYAMPAP
jgi:hypothetical protein